VTSAPHVAFGESGVAGVNTAFLPATPEPGSEGTPGGLFVVNRGPKGIRIWRCRRCEYAEPATEPRAVKAEKVKHTNPRSGTGCLSTAFSRPVHLGHLFPTDVRQIRFARTAPASEGMSNDQDARQGFVHSLVEAVRLSAAELLQVDLRELRATWLMNGSKPDVVLYDGVTGGAGYARRIGQVVSMQHLLEAVQRRLDCDCAAACRKCLLDYTNQRLWDALDRRPVLAWLGAILAKSTTNEAFAALAASPWPEQSLAGLKERLAGASEILFYAPRWLEPGVAPEPTVRDFVVDLMRAGRKIYIGSTETLPRFGAQTPELRSLVEHLAPWLRARTLTLFRAPRPAPLAGHFAPRVMAGVNRAWLTRDDNLPLFSGLLVGHVAELTPEERLKAEIGAWLRRWEPVDVERLTARPEVRFHAYKPGEVRDFNQWFGPLTGSTVERLRICDPYALNGERHRGALVRFVADFARIAGNWPTVIEISFKDPADLRDGDGLSAAQQDAAFKRELQARGKPAGIDVRAGPIRRGPRRDFHDRDVTALVVHPEGSREIHRYSLSGGIDRFMDTRYECAVTHSIGSGA
jgi:uncharacterized protein DUF1998